MSFEYRRAVIAMMLCTGGGVLFKELKDRPTFEKNLTTYFGNWQDQIVPSDLFDLLNNHDAIQKFGAAAKLLSGGVWGTGEHPPEPVQKDFADWAASKDSTYLAGFRAGWEAAEIHRRKRDE
jgi:hypothetical protein